MLAEIKVGDVRDLSNFMNAVIDEKSFDNIINYIGNARNTNDAEIVFGGTGDKSKGYFVQPTIIQAYDPHFVTMTEEIFGPVLTVHVYKDKDFDQTVKLVDETSPLSHIHI